ncbi:MAG: carboxypeptidase-like regulatory domain-containing protein [Flavobacterium sp.]|nr:carboxypeptidase-like regulatory domain-containing protein [Flavobacterium sp.]
MNKFLVFFLFLTFSLSAQIRGVVKDSITGEPIPFVNIWVENETVGTTSESNGSFSLDIKEEKMLVFSALGYEVKKASSRTDIILLKPKVFELKEVVIEQPKFKNEIEVGNYETSGFRIGLGNINSAVYFKPYDEMITHPFLKKIKFLTKSDIEKAKIRIKILSINADNSPGESLIDEEIIVSVKKGKNKNTIDLSGYRFKIPLNGFFISFEKLLIEENKYYTEHTYKDHQGNKITQKSMSIEPELCFIPIEYDIIWQSTINGNWTKSKKHILKDPKSYENLLMRKYHDKYLAPSMTITLTN